LFSFCAELTVHGSLESSLYGKVGRVSRVALCLFFYDMVWNRSYRSASRVLVVVLCGEKLWVVGCGCFSSPFDEVLFDPIDIYISGIVCIYS
jgi:hypothetical protein